MLADISSTLGPGLSCPSNFIAVQALLSTTSVLSTLCCPSTLTSLPSTLTTIPAPCVSLQTDFANANPLPVPTTLQTIPATLQRAELKPRATTSKTTSTTSHSTSHSTTSTSHSTSTTSSKTTSSTSATSTAKSTSSKHSKMHISTALKIILAIVLIVFILTLILIAYCCYRKISKNRKGKGKTSSLPFSKENGSGLGINGIGGGNAYRLGANGQETGLAGGPNGREKESGAGYESFRESGSAYDAYRGEARKSFQLEQERIKAGLVGPVVKP